MRHVSRTHRVALDWLFDRIKLDPKIQIKYVDTKHQLADILTKGNFTCDEWNNLLYLCNISHFNSQCRVEHFSLTGCNTMAKTSQSQEDGRTVPKSRPTMVNLASSFSTSSSTVQSPIASRSPGILKASIRSDWIGPGTPKDSIKTQRRVLKDSIKMQFWTRAQREFSRRTKISGTRIIRRIKLYRETSSFLK